MEPSRRHAFARRRQLFGHPGVLGMYEKRLGRPFGLSGVLCAAIICTPAWAQVGERADAPDEEDQVELQTFEVTGSRIRRVDFESAQPVVVLTREDIERTGLVNIGDLLQEVPMAGSALNRTFNNGGTGTTEVDLRNLRSTARWYWSTAIAGLTARALPALVRSISTPSRRRSSSVSKSSRTVPPPFTVPTPSPA
jgi:hypothetical protein